MSDEWEDQRRCTATQQEGLAERRLSTRNETFPTKGPAGCPGSARKIPEGAESALGRRSQSGNNAAIVMGSSYQRTAANLTAGAVSSASGDGPNDAPEPKVHGTALRHCHSSCTSSGTPTLVSFKNWGSRLLKLLEHYRQPRGATAQASCTAPTVALAVDSSLCWVAPILLEPRAPVGDSARSLPATLRAPGWKL